MGGKSGLTSVVQCLFARTCSAHLGGCAALECRDEQRSLSRTGGARVRGRAAVICEEVRHSLAQQRGALVSAVSSTLLGGAAKCVGNQENLPRAGGGGGSDRSSLGRLEKGGGGGARWSPRLCLTVKVVHR